MKRIKPVSLPTWIVVGIAALLLPRTGQAQEGPLAPAKPTPTTDASRATDPANASKSISRMHAGVRGGDLGGGLTFERRIAGAGPFRISTETVTFFTASSPSDSVTVYRISGEQRARVAYRLIGSLESYGAAGVGVRYTTVSFDGTNTSLITTGVAVIVPAVVGMTITLGDVFEIGVEGGMLYDIDNELLDGIVVAGAGIRF